MSWEPLIELLHKSYDHTLGMILDYLCTRPKVHPICARYYEYRKKREHEEQLHEIEKTLELKNRNIQQIEESAQIEIELEQKRAQKAVEDMKGERNELIRVVAEIAIDSTSERLIKQIRPIIENITTLLNKRIDDLEVMRDRHVLFARQIALKSFKETLTLESIVMSYNYFVYSLSEQEIKISEQQYNEKLRSDTKEIMPGITTNELSLLSFTGGMMGLADK